MLEGRLKFLPDLLRAVLFCAAFLMAGSILYTASYCQSVLAHDLQKYGVLVRGGQEDAAPRVAAFKEKFPNRFNDSLELLRPEEVLHHATWTVIGRYGLMRSRPLLSYYEKDLGFERYMTGELAAFTRIDLYKLKKLKSKKDSVRLMAYAAYFLAVLAPAYYLSRVIPRLKF
ncbi:MAG TPA: hypothetical protein VL688_06910 [Verrucomicrobiae bacterium]|jgi:hypothetical protein|nr:hypothetical protein [Verrucomicrobiae bacterium]